jgi:hypothetical protein
MAEVTTPLSQRDLEAYLWGAAILLRGLVDASDYKQYIFPLLFFKRLSDVWDEDYAEAFEETGDEGYSAATANDRFTIPPGAHWKDAREATQDVGRVLLNAYRAIEAANPARLQGVFGNAAWTDKAQMPDATLKNLIEHFSKQTLSLTRVPEDELGNGYEYLIKQFADDSGHTAQEFYTNRTLVHLMAQMLEPQPGESIYDPTCGTGGMLISCLAEVKRNGGDTRSMGLYHHRRHRPHEPGAARRLGFRHPQRQHPARAGAGGGRPPQDLRCGAGQSALFHQKVEPRGLAERPMGAQLPRDAAAGPRRLRLFPAHPEEHGSAHGALCDPLSAWCAVSK